MLVSGYLKYHDNFHPLPKDTILSDDCFVFPQHIVWRPDSLVVPGTTMSLERRGSAIKMASWGR